MQIRRVYKRKLSMVDKLIGYYLLLQEMIAKLLMPSSDYVYKIGAKKYISKEINIKNSNV